MTAEALAILVAGIIAPLFIQFIKERLGWAGWKAQWLAWGLCVLIAALSLFATRQLGIQPWPTEPASFIATLGVYITAIVGLANIIYKAKFDQPGT